MKSHLTSNPHSFLPLVFRTTNRESAVNWKNYYFQNVASSTSYDVVTCICRISQIIASAISTQEVQTVLALNVKPLHSTINVLNIPPPLHAPCTSPLSIHSRYWLIAVVDGCAERRKEARWRAKMSRCGREMTGCFLPPSLKFQI